MATSKYNQFIQQASSKYGVPANLIAAVIQRESSGDPEAASGTGPVGLMQISNSLAKQYGYSAKDRLDPEKNIDMGARYIKDNLKAFNGDIQKAMVGYSEGIGGAKQMFSGKRAFTKQAYDSMTNKNFTPFYSQEQQAAVTAHKVGNPIAALTESQQQDQFSPDYISQEGAQQAPTQADVMAQQAGSLSNNQAFNQPEAQYTSAYQQPQKELTPEEQSQQGWGQAALMAAALLGARGNKITGDSASGVGAGRGGGRSSYNAQTQAVLNMLNRVGSNYMG